MKPVFTADEMRLTEANLFKRGVKSIHLMESAAKRLFERVSEILPPNGTCIFACGTGGNGGDGYAAARLLAEKGARAVVIRTGMPRNEDALINMKLAEASVFALADINALDGLPKPDVWVDCIFGIGLKRKPEGASEKLIEKINADRRNGSKVVSCDLPSGLDADTGHLFGACVSADETVTFQTAKRGHYLGQGPNVCGAVNVMDIGIPADCYPGGYARLAEDDDMYKALPKRFRTAHKNDFGHLLVIAGSRGMAGAAALTATAALRCGTGLVTIACPNSIVDTLQTLVPCAMCVGLSEKNGAIDEDALKTIAQALNGKTAVAIGPGLSRRASPNAVRLVLESGIKTVLDADALNLISENPDMKRLLNSNHAVTPHPGEAARLIGEKIEDAAKCALKLKDLNCAALLKGAASLIVGNHLTLSTSGCAGMAKGGSGDALTGIVGALLAQGLDCETALWAASQLHGRAGEEAAKEYGEVSMLPTDLISCLGKVYRHAQP